MMSWKAGLISLLVLMFGVFVLQNMDALDIRFLFWSFKANRLLVLLLVWIAGLSVVGWIGATLSSQKSSKNTNII